jgi:hypothetical protein
VDHTKNSQNPAARRQKQPNQNRAKLDLSLQRLVDGREAFGKKFTIRVMHIRAGCAPLPLPALLK